VSPHSYVRVCLDAMKEDGARITRTRKAVIDCLSTTSHALTPQEIMKHVTDRVEGIEGIDLASVYRILKYMSELGLVHQVGPNGGFFPCIHSHCGTGIHIITRCNSCESTTELHIPDEKTTSLMLYLQNEIDFLPEEHILEIKGTCGKCSGKPRSL
jgi:Fe2+ or Zn2+ uptake regulation protein